MADRKALSKKTRFEVFKRDKFTCQYCGKSAPDAVLEVDHIVPVAEGGGNEVTNLVTACFDCNRGKGARKLSDDSVIKKQKAQLDILAERREQLEMMYEWQMGLVDETDEQVKRIEAIVDRITGYELTDNGKERVRKLVTQFGFPVVARATRISFEQYGHATDNQWEHAFSKIGGICYNTTHKTCKQCIHYVGYDFDSHMVECELDFGGSNWCNNSYAEDCDYYDYKWNRGGEHG